MDTYKEWFNHTKNFSHRGFCLVYKQTKLDRLLAKILPHVIPFISKRRRAAIRSYWKHRYARKACTALCNLLKNQEYKPRIPIQFTDELYEWEIIEKGDNNEQKR